jgi:hypothetical protein
MNEKSLTDFLDDEAKKRSDLEQERDKLFIKIKNFNAITWIVVGFGFFPIAIGLYRYFCCRDIELNELGDFYSGSVASLWSLAGLLFIYVAFLGQKQQLLNQQIEISHSKEEVRQTRMELEGQKEEFKIQNKTLKLQRFENTFFNMINLLHEIINLMGDGTTSLKGRSYINGVCRAIDKEINSSKRTNLNQGKTKLEVISLAYNRIWLKRFRDNFEHYFRHVFSFLYYIRHKSNLPEEEEQSYIDILISQFSSDELYLIFYYAIFDRSCHPEYSRLLNYYDIFDLLELSRIPLNKDEIESLVSSKVDSY